VTKFRIRILQLRTLRTIAKSDILLLPRLPHPLHHIQDRHGVPGPKAILARSDHPLAIQYDVTVILKEC
jgi:hypothetical protein